MSISPDKPFTFHRVADVSELAEDEIKTVEVGGVKIVLTHHQGEYGALDFYCTHQRGPLGEGKIVDGWLRCPLHDWGFRPLTGEASSGGAPLKIYPLEVRDDGIYVGIISR